MKTDKNAGRPEMNRTSTKKWFVTGIILLIGGVITGVISGRVGMNESFRSMETQGGENTGGIAHGIDTVLTGTAVGAIGALAGLTIITVCGLKRLRGNAEKPRI